MQQQLPGLEGELQVKHASVITQFEEQLNDDPEYVLAAAVNVCTCGKLSLA